MKIHGILETCLYATNLNETEEFYRNLPGIDLIAKEVDRHLFFRCGNSMLLIFNPLHTSTIQSDIKGDKIPLHGVTGEGHIAFAVSQDELPKWKRHLQDFSIAIESEVTWPNDSTSVYFRDPAGNSLELVSPSIWEKT